MAKQNPENDSSAPIKVEIFDSWCKRCGICAAFCPANVIRMDENGVPTVTDDQKCKGCRLCELRCPDFAIRIFEKKTEANH